MAKNDDKPLLNEGTVRRFMKLAEIGGLSDKFVGDIYEQEEEEELPPEGLEAGAEMAPEEEEELPPGNRMYENEKLADVVDDEAIVNEVAKRVAARLIRASRAAKK